MLYVIKRQHTLVLLAQNLSFPARALFRLHKASNLSFTPNTSASAAFKCLPSQQGFIYGGQSPPAGHNRRINNILLCPSIKKSRRDWEQLHPIQTFSARTLLKWMV